MKSVCLSAMIAPGPDEPGLECWGVSGAFRNAHKNANFTRCFAMDDLSYMPPEWADEVNLLPERVRYITIKHYDEIPRSEPYPIREVIHYFNGRRYWNSTLAYMISLAIYERYERIVLSGAHWPHDSEEYINAIPCINFWTGVAMGAGIKVEVHGPCCVAKSYSWEPEMYGYETNSTREIIHGAMAASYLFAAKFPLNFIKHVDIDVIQETVHA